jgi:DNA repair exonuclease SbcCD ATPase subunit
MATDPLKILEDATRALEKTEKALRRLADWDDPVKRRAYINEYKKKQREKRIPKDGICPVCKKPVIARKSWVVRRGCTTMCRSCFTKENRK